MPSAVDAAYPVTTGTMPALRRGMSSLCARARVSSASGLAWPNASSVMTRPWADNASAFTPRALKSAATIGAETCSPYVTIASSVRAVHSRSIATLRSNPTVRSVRSPISLSVSPPPIPRRSATRLACAAAMSRSTSSAPAPSPSWALRAARYSPSVVPAVAETTTMRSPARPATMRATFSSAVGDATEVPPFEQADEDAQFVRRIEAVHIGAGVGLGIAKADGLRQGVAEVASRVELRADERGRAVEQTAQHPRARGAQLPRGRDDRYRGGDARLEAEFAPRHAGGLVQPIPFLRDELLVRGDDVLAPLEGGEVQIQCGCRTADDLDHDMHVRVVEERE